MRTHFRAFEDFKSLFPSKPEKVFKKCVITTLHILRQKLFAYVHYGQTVIHILHDPISQEILIVQQFNLVIGWVRAKNFKFPTFQQFGSHEDQVLNWGPLWKHCKLGSQKRGGRVVRRNQKNEEAKQSGRWKVERSQGKSSSRKGRQVNETLSGWPVGFGRLTTPSFCSPYYRLFDT